jgi:hypothetical protein
MRRINDDLDAPFPEPPPPLPSRSELERLLPLMDNAQKAEMLALLEARDRAQAAQPVDTMPLMEELLGTAWRSEAATSADPEAWLAAMRAHEEAAAYYMGRLRVGRPAPRTMRECSTSRSFRRTVQRRRAERLRTGFLIAAVNRAGEHITVPPLPHHRGYGSVPRRFGGLSKGQLLHGDES